MENTPPPPGEGEKYQPMSFGGKILKGEGKKGDNVNEKGRKVKEKGKRVKKMRNGEVKG